MRAWLLLPLLVLAGAAQAEEPAVARPQFTVGTERLGSGTAFFLDTGGPVGTVAVTTAHAFEDGQLSQTREVAFVRGRTGRGMSVSTRLLARGRPFSEDGAELRDDYLVFALDTPLSGGRTLRAAPGAPEDHVGQRVRILGVPAAIDHDEDDLFGSVKAASRARMEVALDVQADLRGWGGAPVVLHPDGGVIGILEAAWPDAGTYRLGVAPIGGVLDALKTPLAGGLGTDFARLDGPPTGAPSDTDSAPPGEPDGGDSLDSQLVLAEPPSPPPRIDEPLLGRAGALSTNLVVEVEYPEDGAYVGDPEGAFLAGRAIAMLGEFKRFDVMLVIDTSDSTRMSSGADINGNGIVGKDRMMGVLGSTDGGDSVLAAEVSAALRIVENLDPRNTRVGVVTFAGQDPPPPGTFVIGGRRPDALTEEPLTEDFTRVKKALRQVYRRGPSGKTNMTAGVRQAIRELKGFRGSVSTPDAESEKVVLFFTDGQPTLPYVGTGYGGPNVRSVMRAAGQARRADVKVHTFAIGPEALAGPIAAVELAEITGGYFTPVRHPGDLLEVIENVSFANIKELTVTNLTLEKPATELIANADGTFGALVPLELGKNEVRVHAVANDGTEAEAIITVEHAPDTPSPQIPKELMASRNRLLERRLLALKRVSIEAEREAAEQVRQDLKIEIERERKEATERAARQRRDLQLEVEREEAVKD
jgi:hypothetical protein